MQRNIQKETARTMKLQPDKSSAPIISGHGPGWVGVNGQRFTHSLLVSSRAGASTWDCQHFGGLGPAHFDELATLAPELVIFGSGLRMRFPPPAWLRTLMEHRIGLETMDTAAACRTYNILAGEGRHVLAALLLETPG